MWSGHSMSFNIVKMEYIKHIHYYYCTIKQDGVSLHFVHTVRFRQIEHGGCMKQLLTIDYRHFTIAILINLGCYFLFSCLI